MIASHSSYAYHTFNVSGDSFRSTEIDPSIVQANFYNLFACSSGRFIEQDALINWYTLQSQYGLNTIGTTKTGSMLNFGTYYTPLSEGLTLGDAFLRWYQNNVDTSQYRVSWHYGMVMVGDPTLKMSRFMNDSIPCFEYTATNEQHGAAGRAYTETSIEGQTCYGSYCFGGTEVTTWYAISSGDILGTNGSTTTTLNSTGNSKYYLGSCPTPDTTPPVISLSGANPIIVYQGTSFSDPGFTATDDSDGDITSSVVVTGTVNTAIIGSYSLNYNVADTAGNAATTITRTVNVVAAPACTDFASTIANHESAGRAYSETVIEGQTCYGSWCFGGTEVTTWYATGSAENLGTNSSVTLTLKEQPLGSGVYVQGECPSDPQPPVVNSTSVSVVADDVIITGTASDPENDIEASVIYFMGGGVECEGTTNFTCTISDLAPGAYEAAVKVTDSGMRDSELVYVNFVVEEPMPAIVTLETLNVVNGTLIATGTAIDINNDIVAIGIALPGPYGVDCTLSNDNFNCEIDVSGFTPGTYPGRVTTVDSRDEWGSAEFEFTIQEIVQHAPVVTIDTVEIIGTTLRVSGTASDVDDDMVAITMGLPGPFVVECPLAANFICEADISGFSPGTYNGHIQAYDSIDQTDLKDFEFTVEEIVQHAPVISNLQHTKDGSTVTITLDVVDQDDDLDTVFLYRTNDIGIVDCDNTNGTQYTCIMELQGTSYGTLTWKARAVDLSDKATDSEEFTIEWQEAASCFSALNSEHIAAGRAHEMYGILVYANGSDDYLGMGSSTTSLEETSAGFWEKVSDCN